MANKINILGSDNLAGILMNAMSKHAGTKDFLETYHMLNDGTGHVVDIEIRVNGVVVPFMESLKEGIDRIMKNMDEEVKKAAIEMIAKRPSLQNLVNELDNAEWVISKALEELKK
jgi:hypothetical protein